MQLYFIVIHLYGTCVKYYLELMVHAPPPRPSHTSKSPKEDEGDVTSISAATLVRTLIIHECVLGCYSWIL